MTIIVIVQRNYNETYGNQHETFWNFSTNTTYIQNPSDITFKWFSLPHRDIVRESFPHFVDAQFYHGSNSTRVTSHDTWEMSAQTICRERLYFRGTF